jgi:hypothetical protein
VAAVGEVQRLSLDQARLRPHLRAQLERAQADIFGREYERALELGVDTTRPGLKVPTGDDRDRLRGLPCIAREVTGAQPGTDPVRELLRKERQRERRRR